MKCLTRNARDNASRIGEEVGLSVSAVIERIRKMESMGIISGYTAIIDEEVAGYSTHALISIRLEAPKYNSSFEEKMKVHSLVMECYYITGDFDYIVRVVTRSAQELTEVLNDIKETPGVSLTRTYVVLSGVKNTRTMQPGEYLLS